MVVITSWVTKVMCLVQSKAFISQYFPSANNDELVQERRNSIANAQQLRLSYINTLIWATMINEGNI